MYNDNTVPLHNESGRKGLKSKPKLLGILLAVLLIVAAAVVIPVVVLKVKKDDKDKKSVPSSPSQPDTSAPTSSPSQPDTSAPTCTIVDSKGTNNGSGPAGTANVSKQMVLSGLDVPWQLAYAPGSTLMFVTERAGKLSQFDAAVDGSLKLLALVPDVAGPNYTAEGGLLGLAYLESPVPYIYIYVTSGEGGRFRNRVEGWTYDKTAGTVIKDKIILDDIPSARENNGGFLLIQGGFLYISTGDAAVPANAQNTTSKAGKILRINLDGSIPTDNPFTDSPVFIYGLRNPAGFSFLDKDSLIIADHGVGGVEKGGDRVIVGTKGSNLGWGVSINCETNKPGELPIIAPRLVYGVINPPGGILVYNAASVQEPENTIPAWQGHVLLTSLRGRHLQDVKLSGAPAYNFLENYVYFLGTVANGGLGRLRSIVLNDRNALFVGTSNCDSRGTDLGLCKNGTRDAIYKISTALA
eukprot:TRINITY_DN1333_c0_g1_i1.p1 TRINITY_DN1333_c0_g1~~TRINITY_DN1333_c0_g1_i1.p1  ORF type:complete len:468 (+),score=81.50 TRINITY_DN1333_c0_g1_i1:96-1499(+)